ncbi:MAG: bifunctional adenosylcobinamide kinase/adenosylcobinamide-phosphate guanylyltransferase [Deinococcota bacterium]
MDDSPSSRPTTPATASATTSTAVAKRILITGGLRSGKSRYAAQLAKHLAGDDVSYIAMLAASDEEMLWRLDGHRAYHPSAWQMLTRHIKPRDAIAKADHQVIVLDSLTGWVANLLLEHEVSGEAAALDAVTRESDQFISLLQELDKTIIIATNEVGLGVLPETSLGRWLREALGDVNQRLATICDAVALVTVGIPQCIKGDLPEV